PRVGEAPRAEVVRARGVVLARAVVVVAEAPAALLRVVRERDALGDPGAVLHELRRRLVVRDVQEEALRALHAGLHEPLRDVADAEPRAVRAVEVDARPRLLLE